MTTGCPTYTPGGAFGNWQLLRDSAQLITSKGLMYPPQRDFSGCLLFVSGLLNLGNLLHRLFKLRAGLVGADGLCGSDETVALRSIVGFLHRSILAAKGDIPGSW